MGSITFTSNLQRHVPCPSMAAEGGTVHEALDRVFAENPLLRTYLLDDQGRLRQHVNVFVNEYAIVDRTRLSDPITPSDDL